MNANKYEYTYLQYLITLLVADDRKTSQVRVRLVNEQFRIIEKKGTHLYENPYSIISFYQVQSLGDSKENVISPNKFLCDIDIFRVFAVAR